MFLRVFSSFLLAVFFLTAPVMTVPATAEKATVPESAPQALRPQIRTEDSRLKKQIADELLQNKTLTKDRLKNFLFQKGRYNARVTPFAGGFEIQNSHQIIFIFKGNRFFSDYKIKKILKTHPEWLGKGFEEALVSYLQAAYHAEGFQALSIEQSSAVKAGQKWIYLSFNEGERVRIGGISLRGSFSKPQKYYVNYIKSHSSPLIRKGFFNKKDLEEGYKNLTVHLKKNGYLQSKIPSDRTVYKDDKVFVTVNLDEGPVSLVRSVSFKGYRAFPRSDLAALMKTRIFRPLKIQDLEEDLKALENFYRERGYLQMKILNKRNIVQKSEEGISYVDIPVEIEEGPQSRIASVSIRGGGKAKESFVRRVLRLKAGEPLLLRKVRAAQTRLSSLGLFSRVSVDFEEAEESHIIVSLAEKKPHAVRIGGGLSAERGLTARSYMEIARRNLFGNGRSLLGKAGGRLHFIEKSPVAEYELSGVYQEPLLFNWNIKGNAGLSHARNIFNYTKEKINGVKKNKARFFTEKNLGENLRAVWSLWNWETRREFCLFQPGCAANFQRIGSTGAEFSYDKRDNIFNPTEGFLVSLSGEYSAPFLGGSSDVQFSKISSQSQLHFPVLNKYTLALELRGGLLFSQKTIPVSRAFILGGQTSLRGYDGAVEGERLPSARELPVTSANEPLRLKNSRPVTRSQYGLLKIELRFPLLKSLKGLVFYDGGGVFLQSASRAAPKENGSARSLAALGHSAGLGFRYEGFLIPLGLDLGCRLPFADPSDCRFHFAVGLF